MIRALLLVLGKELRASIRDPHVLVFLLFPILVYPGMLLGMIALVSYQEGLEESASYALELDGPPDLVAALEVDNAAQTGSIDALVAGGLDAVVQAVSEGDQLVVEVHQISTRGRSRSATRQILERLEELEQERLEAKVAELGIDPRLVEPVEVARRAKKGQGQLTRWLAAVLLCGVVPIAMLISGIYPAVELIVSERERGTLETTLITPVPRAAILGGKVGAIVVLMIGAGLGNAVALALTANQIVFVMTSKLSALWLPPASALLAVPAVVGLGLLLAGANLVAVLPARTFKEGEYSASLLMTFLTLAILSGFIGLVSDVGGDWWMLAPGANAVLALYYALIGEIGPAWCLVPALVDGLLGIALIAVAARVMDREDALFGGWLPRWLAPIRRFLPE